jgi:hypothetical protein
MSGEYLDQIARRRLDGSEPLGGVPGVSVLDYWRWAYSDVVENIQRGIFAEFLVASALGLASADRVGWNGYDLDYAGYKIEVKSSAYLQSWLQRRHSRIVFGIGARQQWVEGKATYEDARYVADAYIFALYGDRDPLTANVLDANRWEFFVVPIAALVKYVGGAKSITESRLREMTDSVTIEALAERVDRTRSGEDFMKPSAVPATPGGKREGNAKPYLVARRKTREHGVLVLAASAREAQLLARADKVIAALGADISAFALSGLKIEQALSAGARDLRNSN